MKCRVLLVDDDLVIRRLVRDVLEDAGYEVDEAEDAMKALVMIEQRQPDLAIMDLFMPGMDGQEAATSWRNHPKASKVPIILMSSAPGADKRAVQMKARGFLAKPFDISDLVRVVANGVSSDAA
jgi:CheY-like chemotaxis protein